MHFELLVKISYTNFVLNIFTLLPKEEKEKSGGGVAFCVVL